MEESCCIRSIANLSHKIDNYNNDIDQQKVILNNDMNLDVDMDIERIIAATTTTTTRTPTPMVLLQLILLSIILDLL